MITNAIMKMFKKKKGTNRNKDNNSLETYGVVLHWNLNKKNLHFSLDPYFFEPLSLHFQLTLSSDPLFLLRFPV